MNRIYFIVSLLFVPFFTQAEERIISAGSAITELIYALGAQDQLVAADVTSKYFTEKSSIPQVGYHRQLSAEGLLALNPSRLIGSSEMGPDSTLENLKSSEVDIVVVPSGSSVTDLYDRIDVIARITGKESQAIKLKKQVKNDLIQLESNMSQNGPKVIFLMLSKGRPANVGGKETTVDKIISLSGAINPASRYTSSYKPVSPEAIIEMQPDYLLVSERAWQSLDGEEGILTTFPLLAATPAGQKGKIIPIPGHALIGGFGLESIRLSRLLSERYEQD